MWGVKLFRRINKLSISKRCYNPLHPLQIHSKTCNDVPNLPIDLPQSKYIKILPNSNSIQSDPSIIIQPKMSDIPATIHGRCFMSWQGVGNAFWDLVECPQCLHPCPKKRNNRYQIDDRIDDRIETRSRHDRDTIRKTMVFMRMLVILLVVLGWVFVVLRCSLGRRKIVVYRSWNILIAVHVQYLSKGWTSKVV